MRYAERIKLGKIVCAEVKAAITCSNDIIPVIELPIVTPASKSAILAKYGERANEYFNYLILLAQYRAKIFDPAKKAGLGKGATLIQTAAVGQLGVGECQELMVHTLLNLLSRGIKDCLMVGIRGTNPDGSGELYNHTIILLSEKAECFLNESSSFEDFRRLPENVVIIDPLLGHVGRAKTYHVDQARYCDIFKFRSIFLCNYFTAENVADTKIIIDTSKRHALSSGLAPFIRKLPAPPLPKEAKASPFSAAGSTFFGAPSAEVAVVGAEPLKGSAEITVDYAAAGAGAGAGAPTGREATARTSEAVAIRKAAAHDAGATADVIGEAAHGARATSDITGEAAHGAGTTPIENTEASTVILSILRC